MKTSATFLFGAVLCAALCISCASAPKEIPESLSAQELVQRAQEASDSYKYEAATAYYKALIERFGSDPSMVVTGEYEIAFIAFKQERYVEAKAGFEALIARYAEPGGSSLPAGFKILAEKVLEKIKEIQSGKK